MNQRPNASDDDILAPENIHVEGKTWTRGKHTAAVRKGYRAEIHRRGGTTIVREVKLPSYLVALDPDVRRRFPLLLVILHQW